MTLSEASELLAELTQQPVRNYSTYDFGREQEPKAVSVIMGTEEALEVLPELRERLGPGLVAFVGTQNWLGDEQHEGAELVVGKGQSQFDIVRIARSDAVNFGMTTDELIEKLTAYDNDCGIDIFQAETDTIQFILEKMPDNLAAFCEDLYAFCPDIVDQGTGDVATLEQEIRETGQVLLWWD